MNSTVFIVKAGYYFGYRVRTLVQEQVASDSGLKILQLMTTCTLQYNRVILISLILKSHKNDLS